jgi:hypothetical protein
MYHLNCLPKFLDQARLINNKYHMFSKNIKSHKSKYLNLMPSITVTTLSVIIGFTLSGVSNASTSANPPTTIKVDLRAGTSLIGTVSELNADSLTLNTEHGEVVLKIRDIEENCWEAIITQIPKTAPKKQNNPAVNKKRLVSEIIADRSTEEVPDFGEVTLDDITYEFRKSFESVNNSAEFIYSPRGQPNPNIAKDNLTIWILDNSDQKHSQRNF